MDPEEVEEIKRYSPSGTRNLRACIRCRLIMTKEQFYDFGCPTCRGVLDMAGSEGRVVACTTTNFQGFISLMRPGAFLSRFNGLESRRPGCYALTVHGKIPDYILHESEVEWEEHRPGRQRSPERIASADEGEGKAVTATPITN